MKKKLLLLTVGCWAACVGFAQVNQFVEIKTSTIGDEPFGTVKLFRKGERIKVKYFAAKDQENGNSVYERYKEWAVNKNVVAYSSGTYMDACNSASTATPIGLCIDQGNVVNSALENDKLDALAIVYATGGMAASNLKDGNLKVTYPDKTSKTLNLRGSAYDKQEFMKWAEEQEATVFQTHLFVYNNVLKIASNSSTKAQPRRFLAVCKDGQGTIVHYIINLPTPAALFNGVNKAFKILKEIEEVPEVVYMINLDTGCQDVFKIPNSQITGSGNKMFQGTEPISNAINLLVYYYE